MRSEITTIIFSKNRACQLELLLRGLTIPAIVQYSCDPAFSAGYEKLMGMYPNVVFVKETTFKDTLFELLQNAGKYIMFLCDDDVALEPFSEECSEFIEMKRNPEIICLSLRLSAQYKGAPVLKNNTWEWKTGKKRSWRFPMSVTSHVFRKEDILETILQNDWIVLPNSLELVLRRNPPDRPLMICTDRPKFINNLANRVQRKYQNKNLGIRLKSLENRFLKGERLSLQNIQEKAREAKDCFMMVGYDWEMMPDETQQEGKESKKESLSSPVTETRRPEITTIVFSKNRACQLDLLLRSLSVPATVLYTFDPEFAAGYEKVIGLHPEISFVRETNFKNQTLSLLGAANDYVMFLADDDVMVNPFSEDCPEFEEFKKNPEIICLSLRADPRYKNAPQMSKHTWKWRGLRSIWGNPMSAGTHVYRKKDIESALTENDFRNMNRMEVLFTRNTPERPLLLCFDKAKFINNAANVVQTRYRSLHLGIPLKYFEEKFLEGERLSLEDMKKKADEATTYFLRTEYEWEPKNEQGVLASEPTAILDDPSETVTAETNNAHESSPELPPKITTIIFSKNRACQLELLLRRFNRPAIVIYNYDNDFEKGYEKLIGMYPNVTFLPETDFRKQVLENLGEYTMFLCDDDIILEPVEDLENTKEFEIFAKNDDILCLSLRLAPYHEKTPIFENGCNMWQWRAYNWRTTGSHFGYPMSVTSHIFRKQDLLQSIGRRNFAMPNQLERILRKKPIDRPYMLCYDTPKIINNLANQVQTFNFCETVGESIKELEKRFLNGDRLSFEDIRKKAMEATTCFLKTEYKWENMKPNNWLSQYQKNITSQLGEDGILEKIFEVIGVDRGWCVDVGACDVPLSNTYVLVKKGWSGIFIEMVEDRAEKLKGVYRENAGSLVINKKVEPSGEDSLDNILKETSLPKEFDFLSIDIDGNDYHVWDSLKNYTPKVVVIEFNPVIKMDDYLQPVDGRGGASLSYMIKLGKAKGYELVSTTPFNAFFVKAEFFDKFGITDNSIKELFTDSNYIYGKDRTKHVNHLAFDYVVKKFDVDVSEPSPTRLPISRNVGFPDLLKELGVKKGVEVGVYKAKYSEVLMSRIPGLELVGIDAWQTYGNYKDYGVNDLEEKAYEDASAVAKRLGFRLMKAWSTDAAKEFADESLDFVYIDGNHDFAHVIEDLAAWSPKVKKDGIIAGHDFFESRQERYGVMYAVPAWCAYKRIPRLFIVADDRFPSWFYIKQ